MLRYTSLVCAVVVIVGVATGQERSRRDAAPRGKARSTLSVLYERIPEIRFQETPFDQVMDWLGEFSHLNLSVRWQTLEDAGVRRDTPISIQARNLRLTQILWMIMNEAGGSDIKLAYRASGSLLVMSTEEDLNREMVTKIYDIADLLVRIPRASRENAFDVTQGMGQGGQGGGGGGGSGGMFGQGQGQGQGQNGDYDDEDAEGQIQQIVELIEQTVEPDSWRNNGGLGTIFPFQRSLIVRNTILVHQRLGGYLTEDDVVGP